ncbi:MAG TPA: ABC transporter ATP-binding protein [Terriglobia bacterium]|nr:ABC transporter ATP-binding protein [Terriglobia bacterium]
MDPIIRVENLGKRYAIGERERYLALRDLLARALKSPARIFRPQAPNGNGRNGHNGHIWALKDVSFDVRQGEVVGIIGRNGAGKTTLLKILARVTKPTRGFADVRGRMGSLLEVGTGFHPELTGRENTFLSGAILGMSKAEIRRKFDEIVAFAEVEKFIDTPVKYYSVGMRMRLAFAVAAHLEPEILLVDEVLSVGDLQFQKKCLGKMGKVAEGGRTILFVSHQMNQIRRLCQRVLWVDDGAIRADGPAKLLVNEYEAASLADEEVTAGEAGASIAFGRWQVESSGTNVLDLDQGAERVAIRIPARVMKPIRKGQYFISLKDANNTIIWSRLHYGLKLDPGPMTFVHEFASLPLMPGIYTWDVGVNDGHRWFDFTLAPELSIVSKNDSHVYGHIKGFLNLASELQIHNDSTQPATELVAEISH